MFSFRGSRDRFTPQTCALFRGRRSAQSGHRDLSTPLGDVERTEKIDDYARARIGEYWIVDPFERAVEVYRLGSSGEYPAPEVVAQGLLKPGAFAGIENEISETWPDK